MSPQESIAHYCITSKLGEGGMGAVYRATDTRLNREVAIKVLPEAFAQDRNRMARFEREAQALASVNHPNIAAIYGIETDRHRLGGLAQSAIVMELVQGEDLKGPIAIETAIEHARQIAAGLEAAHEKGIVHRDLKPANVKVRSDGVVKILDFGLATAADRNSSAPGASPTALPTLPLEMTRAGMILGTPAYMAPEQARGQSVDKRADIWAFGCVLYELLTGKAAFRGETVSDILACVIHEQPDVSAIPRHLRLIVEKGLRKDPHARWRDIGDVRMALEEAQSVAVEAGKTDPRSRRMPWILLAATSLAAIGFAILALRSPKPRPAPSPTFDVALGPNAVTGRDTTMVLSNDRSRMVFPIKTAEGKQALAIRFLEQRNATPLAGTENAVNPFFSPDGEWVGFFVSGKVRKVPARGGTPVTLYAADGVGADGLNLVSGRGASWSDKGFIVMALGTGSALTRISDQGGPTEPVTKLEKGEDTHRWQQVLPGDDSVLFTASSQRTNYEHATVEVVSLKTGRRKVVQRDGFFARYLPSGHLVFLRQDTLMAVPFDLGKMEARGTAVPVIEEVAGSAFGGGQFTFAANGTLAYLRGTLSGNLWEMQWLESGGKTSRVLPPGVYWDPRLSPDGRKVAYSSGRGENSIWIGELERQAVTRITFLPNSTAPRWTPDGQHITFISSDSARQGVLYLTRADGSGEPQRLAAIGDYLPAGFTPDGKTLLIYRSGPLGSDLAIVRIDQADPNHPKVAPPETLLHLVSRGTDAGLSPDGKWLAYVSRESGAPEVYVRPFEGAKLGEGRWQISTSGGTQVRWSRTTPRIYYLGADLRPMVVNYQTNGSRFQAGQPTVWADKTMRTPSNIPIGYDVTPDGERMIFTSISEEAPTRSDLHAVFVLNFFGELQRRFP